jgi:3-deoxy-D-manno-octulosonate 8-phosphate phosphatase (KDO 8-P phosphatase)
VSSQQLLKRARGVAFLLLDVDGVLTDGKVTFTSDGHEVKSFDIQDGHGLKQLAHAGVGIGLLSGRNSPIVDRRQNWRSTRCTRGSPTTLPIYEALIARRGLRDQDVRTWGMTRPTSRFSSGSASRSPSGTRTRP